MTPKVDPVVQSTQSPVRSHVGLLKKAGNFAAIGVVNAAIDFAVFWAAVQTFDIPKIPANVLAWAVAVTASYMMNSFITFAAESGRQLKWSAYTKFVAGGVAGMIANTAALVIGDWVLSFFLASEDWRLAIAKIGAIGVSFVVNFSMSHFVVFRQKAANDN
jgi:putative flippase GtrA